MNRPVSGASCATERMETKVPVDEISGTTKSFSPDSGSKSKVPVHVETGQYVRFT